jgi:hypothetical protein
MWNRSFEGRLRDWHRLRQTAVQAPKSQCLDMINAWWFRAPWSSYYLHWDDRSTWPDPWQLLEDNLFCSLARGLGMLYTISLLDRADIQNAELVQTENDNLVLIDSGKYVLNWDPHRIVNISLGTINPRHRVQQTSINQTIR